MRSAVTTLAAVLALLAAPEALAFCRARSCDRRVVTPGCEIDARNCLVSGHQLFWSSNCLQIGVNGAGSVLNGISFEQLKGATEAAFQTWMNADCIPGAPSVRVEVVGPIECDKAGEYNGDAGNINLVVIRDDKAPHDGAVDALGTTLIRFNADTGEILDADIEIYGMDGNLGVEGNAEVDLQSVLTHEAGHLLGLDHSDIVGSTMIAKYDAGDTSLRTLELDDVQGICAIFPPGARISSSCEPRGGFSDQCGGYIEPKPVEPNPPPPAGDDGGCATAPSRSPGAPTAMLLAVVLTAARRRCRAAAERRIRCSVD
jgi:hypothetical protein